MSTILFSKVTALPATLVPSTMYLVAPPTAGADELELYVSSTDGLSARHIPTKTEVQAMVAAGAAAFTNVHVVADIAARNALAPAIVTIALALDATADTTVLNGAATYVYNPATTSWTKIAEYESLDMTLQWANIQGRPTASAAAIDSAIAQAHTHLNMPTLDLLGADANNELVYNGKNVAARLETAAW